MFGATEERLGSLELGKEADFVVLSCKSNAQAELPLAENDGNPWASFAYDGNYF